MTHRIIVLGPPGAGKGTQAIRISERFQIPTISTGALFRAHMAAEDELGREAKRYIDAGNLVPDEVTIAMLAERLQEPDTERGFILDGFPRNLSQAAQLDELLTETPITMAVEFVVDEAAMVGRMLRRAEIEGRSDDTADVIRHRLEVYREQTAPLVDLYEQRGVLRRVDAMGEIDEVTARVISAVEQPRVS